MFNIFVIKMHFSLLMVLYYFTPLKTNHIYYIIQKLQVFMC